MDIFQNKKKANKKIKIKNVIGGTFFWVLEVRKIKSDIVYKNKSNEAKSGGIVPRIDKGSRYCRSVDCRKCSVKLIRFRPRKEKERVSILHQIKEKKTKRSVSPSGRKKERSARARWSARSGEGLRVERAQ